MGNEVAIKNIGECLLNDNSLKTLCKDKNYTFNEFVACVMAQVKLNDVLQKCSQKSILECCIKSAQIGLKIDANGYAYLTAFENKKTNTTNCNIIIGYRGYVSLIKANNPKVSSITSFVISKKDIEENRLIIEEGEKRTLIYKRNLLQSENSLADEEIAGFLSIVYYKDNSYDYCFLTKEDVDRVRNDSNNYKYAKDVKNTIWGKHYVAMGKKTTFRQLVKWCDFSGIDKLNEIDNEDYQQQENYNKYSEKGISDYQLNQLSVKERSANADKINDDFDKTFEFGEQNTIKEVEQENNINNNEQAQQQTQEQLQEEIKTLKEKIMETIMECKTDEQEGKIVNRLDKLVKDGKITEEEAKNYKSSLFEIRER